MSFSKHKYLLDENVRQELYQYLKTQSVDIIQCPKGLKNGEIAKICIKKRRILITNDKDFTIYSSDKISGVIWLKIPQEANPATLIRAFSRFIKSKLNHLKSKLVVVGVAQIEFDDLGP